MRTRTWIFGEDQFVRALDEHVQKKLESKQWDGDRAQAFIVDSATFLNSPEAAKLRVVHKDAPAGSLVVTS